MFFLGGCGVWCLERGCVGKKRKGCWADVGINFSDVVGDGNWKLVATVACGMKGPQKSSKISKTGGADMGCFGYSFFLPNRNPHSTSRWMPPRNFQTEAYFGRWLQIFDKSFVESFGEF